MSRNFPQFLSLPSEIQLMIFDQFLAVSLSPRIVLLDTEKPQLPTLLRWDWRASNREALEQETPEAVASTLLQLNNDTASYAAKQFLEQFIRPSNPPRVSQALMGLGLCLCRDVFWLPDDLLGFVNTIRCRPVNPAPPKDECNMSNVMISLHSFTETMRWATQRGDESEEPQSLVSFWQMVLIKIFDSFPAAWDLIIMVDTPRGQQISWDQIEVVRGGDPALGWLRAGGDGRYHSLYQTYEALNKILVDEDPTRDLGSRALPKLSFAFRRPVRSPPRMTIE